MYKRLFEIDDWKIIENKLNKEDMRLAESITSMGNGYMGMRGNFEETYSGDTHRGFYVGGVWFPDKTRVGWWKNGYPQYFGKVINALNITGIRLFVDGVEVDLDKAEVLEYYRELDMKKSVLFRKFTVNTPSGRVHVETERFLSIADKEICVQKYEVTPLDNDCTILLVPYIDSNVHNEDSNYDEMFWDAVDEGCTSDGGYVAARTKENSFGVERFTVLAHMTVVPFTAPSSLKHQCKPLHTETACSFDGVKGEKAGIYKYTAVVTTRDMKEENLSKHAMELSESASSKGYHNLLSEHISLWKERWDRADVEIKGDKEAQQGIRFNIFQLFSTYYGEDPRLNIGPKGFTGEKYGGATYWDTEAFVFPMYLAISEPHVAKNLLIYRYNQLDGAYHNARMQGLKGALYPMVTFTGIECHNEWEITFEEIHRNAAIAYAIYNYVNYTKDETYLYEYGIDVLTGICRFWADRVHYSNRHGKYMIHGVTGPNEYENNVNNNWYTNRMASWCLDYTVSVVKHLLENGHSLGINEDELSKWLDISSNMYLPEDKELGIFVQHDTFLDKDLRTVDTLDQKDRPINQNWSWDRILRSCFIKQADVLQGLYSLGHLYDTDVKKRNFEFYEPMTVHESSLSSSIHSILAAELGFEEKAVEMYKRTARLDLDNYNNDTEDGLHITSMSGSWLAIVQGFAGMRTAEGHLSFNPFLPKIWEGYSFNINYRNRLINISVDKTEVIAKLLHGDNIEIFIYGEPILLKDCINIPLKRYNY